jgi:hypothetical protein
MLTIPLPKVPIIAFAPVVALEIERGLQPRAEDGVPDERFCSLGVTPERSPRAKRLILLPLRLLVFIFYVFSPKIACQVPKPPKPYN